MLKRLSDSKFGFLCSVPGLVGLVLFILYPAIYNFYVCFLRYDNIRPVTFTGLSNFKWLFSSHEFLISLRVSAIYSFGTTALALLIGFLLAYCLHRINKFEAIFRTLVILPWAVPLVISGLMWKWILNQDMGILNYLLQVFQLIDNNISFLSSTNLAMLAGILASAWVYIPLATIYLLAGLEAIPRELFQSANVDGADELQKLWYLSLPLIKSQVGLVGIIIAMFTFRTPTVFFTLTRGGPAKATYHIGLFLKDTIFMFLDWGHGAALGVFMTLIIVVFVAPSLYLTQRR